MSELRATNLEGSAKKYRKQPSLVAVRDTFPVGDELCAEFDGHTKPCRYLSKIVYLENGSVLQSDIKRFAELFDHCIEHGRLGYGQLSPIEAIGQ